MASGIAHFGLPFAFGFGRVCPGRNVPRTLRVRATVWAAAVPVRVPATTTAASVLEQRLLPIFSPQSTPAFTTSTSAFPAPAAVAVISAVSTCSAAMDRGTPLLHHHLVLIFSRYAYMLRLGPLLRTEYASQLVDSYRVILDAFAPQAPQPQVV